MPGLCEKARKQPSSRRAASFSMALLLVFLVRSVLCSFRVQNQIQPDFQGCHNNCSQAPHPLLAMQGMPGRGSGGASRNNAHTSYHIVHDFHMLCAKLFIPCSSLLQHQEKKNPTCSSKSSFSSRAEESGEYLCTTPDSLQRRSFFCG